ncbi:TetR/AcrR family transcriptional regulator [Ferrimicrobium sp.]|uniref:TetR/AcrR family transcriptional regulator n=1 Tax=Ferrimicrobium sp. TaxID=2926050 RepID=UPI002628263A|nr:TetR/AcrR family transcriptional regulator [Ferrimicrobium sp.]
MGAVGELGFDDLTAKARLRDAAMRLFAEHGVEATSIRDIAKAVGVSGGLVRHHFGSKEALRDACDTYALTQLVRFKEQAAGGGQAAGPQFLSAGQPVLLRYFVRSMLDGSPSAREMFSQMVAQAEDWLEANHPDGIADRHAYCAVLVAMELGALMMREQLSTVLGADMLEPEGLVRLARAKVEFYSTPLLNPKAAATALAAIDQLQQSPPKRRPTRKAKR